ncbi:zinc finger domain-containing protein [Nocardiopsis metallicus]|uniref:DNA-binding phage zinc finger domain-containing protein n=1 Tax=Nocardiopsis metallicus TaxID=179819 RepID=A0A840W3Q8_9ACTN|nr:hypothetical protein [Nocardiopsis metallicus]MBB5491519.1 hypothetical protein [Nocardiopsis metallicus]
MVYPLAISCPVCGAGVQHLCLTPSHAVRRIAHPRRTLAAAAVDIITALAPRIPAVERWPLAQHLVTAPDHTTTPVEPSTGAHLDLEAARAELETTAQMLEQLRARAAADPGGVSVPGLVEQVEQARSRAQHLVAVLTEACREQCVRELVGAGASAAEIDRALRVLRAERVDAAVQATTPPMPAAAGAPVWRLDYRTDGLFWLRPPEGEGRAGVVRARGQAPTLAAAVRSAALFAGPGNRVVPDRPAAARPVAEAAEKEPLIDPALVENLLDESEPAYTKFLAACDRLRARVAGVQDLGAWWGEQAAALQASHPQCRLPLRLSSELPPGYHDHAETRVEATAWVPSRLIVGTHYPVWGRLGARPEVPERVLKDLATREDLGAFTKRLFAEPMQLERVTGWAGPLYQVSEGNHRTHLLRAAGVPWVAAHLAQSAPSPVVDLYLLVKDDEDQPGRGEEGRYPAERARHRRALIEGLIARGVIDAHWDQDRPDLLWCRRLPAPWLLRSAQHASAVNAAYEAAYPGALAQLGIPEGVGTDPGAWRTWLTHHEQDQRTTVAPTA